MAAPAAAAPQVHAAAAELPATAEIHTLAKTAGAEQQGAQQIGDRAGGQAGGGVDEHALLGGGQETTVAAQAALLNTAQKVTDYHDLAIHGWTKEAS